MRLWIVGQWKDGDVVGQCAWDFQGVFSTKEKAVAACRDSTYFLTAFCLDEELPHETMVDYPSWYPHQQPEPTWPWDKGGE